MAPITGTRIPIKNRIRRVAESPSFKATREGRYSIIKKGQKTELTASANPWIEENSIEVNIMNGPNRAATFVAKKLEGRKTWDIFIRWVEPGYYGYNIGRVGLRLIEQQIRNLGAEKLTMKVYQKQVLITALRLGYKIRKEDEPRFKKVLKIPVEDPLPKMQELISKIKRTRRKFGHTPIFWVEKTLN